MALTLQISLNLMALTRQIQKDAFAKAEGLSTEGLEPVYQIDFKDAVENGEFKNTPDGIIDDGFAELRR